MCKWCDDLICYYTTTLDESVLVTTCRLCGKNLPKSRNLLDSRVNSSDPSPTRSPSTASDRKRTLTIITKLKSCNLSRSMPGMLSPAPGSPSDKLPPISPTPDHGAKSLAPSPQPEPQSFPPRSFDFLKNEVEIAEKNDNWKAVEDCFADIFSSTSSLSSTFKNNEEINLKKIFKVHDMLCNLPENVHRVVLKSLISCLLSNQQQQTEEETDAVFVALLNPLFCGTSSYLVFAHILRRVSLLHNQHLYQIVIWLSRMGEERFRSLLKKIQDFISCRLFPPSENELPPLQKSSWWVPSATKVLALLRAANDLSKPKLASCMDFYNHSIDHLDLLHDYNEWQHAKSQSKFSFCQYPFILSINAKRKILHQDSEQQMVIVARNALLAEVKSSSEPNMEMLFLTVNLRRSHLVSDSLEELTTKRKELKKKLKVSFLGEPGLDMGGLKKEWFLLLVREIFQTHYGMFKMDNYSIMYWFCSNSSKSLQEYNLVGKLMGLAVYNGINLDVRFPTICYRKLLSPAIVPYKDPHALVGVTRVDIEDVVESMPEVGKGLKDLLEYDGNVEDDLCLTFQVAYSESDQVMTKNLKDDGENIPVTNQNRKEYVELYMDFLFNKNVYFQFQAFYLGFHSVCASNALIMFQPEEIELLVCGCPVFDMTALKNVIQYDGYSPDDETIEYFWVVVLEEFGKDQQKQFLTFTTGSDRLPVGGVNEMEFKISRYDDLNSLPMSHTCFNQLILPNYKDKEVLKKKLTIAIQNAEGFGLK